jgi:hypothetical protein
VFGSPGCGTGSKKRKLTLSHDNKKLLYISQLEILTHSALIIFRALNFGTPYLLMQGFSFHGQMTRMASFY